MHTPTACEGEKPASHWSRAVSVARKVWLGLVVIILSWNPNAGLHADEITLDVIAKKAEERARKPFHSPRADLPEVLRQDKLDYDKYREIRFRRQKALWNDKEVLFRVEFFHPGYLYQEPVHVHEFTASYSQPVRFVQDFFDYGKLPIANQIPTSTGYAGFRLLFPLNNPDNMDELGAFLGASYFRLLGKGQRYGASARGLALDSGESDRPEEFPLFTDWWLGKPGKGERTVRLFAILDSVSCTGAYEFLIRPGETTSVEVQAVIFLRAADKVRAANPKANPLKTIGLAPLTSMFRFGKNSEHKMDDYRPEVHDSDGLLVRLDNGESLWRPLNPTSVLRHQTFPANNIRGFGLLQRDRRFESYEDLFNLYQLVPSLWVEPRGNWGEGELHLVELPAHYEGFDNIVAFWDPKVKPQPLQPFHFAYALLWTRETDVKLSENTVASTRVGAVPGNPRQRQFAIDFSGPKLAGLSKAQPPQVAASCGGNAIIVESLVFPNSYNNSWRIMLKMEPKTDNKEPVDIRCSLKQAEEVLTETWVYRWSPP